MPEQERDLRVPAALFLGYFALYLFCAYPWLAPRDSADLALAAFRAGVAHPPGYPLYALLGHIWIALIPLGNVAYRLNVMSALAGAGAVVVVYFVALRWYGSRPAAGAASLLGCSPALFKFGLLPEMYSLHALFIALLFLLANGESDTVVIRAALSGLTLGLGLVNHQSLILILPCWLMLWRDECSRHRIPWKDPARLAGVLACAGLSLYAFVWVRVVSLGTALDIVLRREYGSLTLAPGLSRPVSLGLLARLLTASLCGASPAPGQVFLFSLSAFGAYLMAKRQPERCKALASGFAAFGPFFFVLTRLDVSDWVARTVLEPAHVAVVVLLCLAAAAAIVFTGEKMKESWLVLAVAMVLLGPHQGLDHRADFSAYDYLHDLRREVPPGSAIIVGGDTALFGLRYLEATAPREQPLKIVSSLDAPHLSWNFEERWKGRVFTTGMSLDALAAWGLDKTSRPLNSAGINGRKTTLPPNVKPESLVPQPQGLVQEVLPESPGIGHERAAWSLSVLRWGPALASGESYAHDVRLSYAFAHYVSARLEEISGAGDPIEHDRWARLLDPEDYRLARAED